MITSTNNSALMSVEFDWSVDTRTKKETRKQEAFKYDTRRLAQGGNDESAYPFDVVDTKLRVRGAGRVMKVRYESTAGKDFQLLGYAVLGIARDDSEASK